MSKMPSPILKYLLITTTALTSITLISGFIFFGEGSFLFDTVMVHQRMFHNLFFAEAVITFVLAFSTLVFWGIFERQFLEVIQLNRFGLPFVIILSISLCRIFMFVFQVGNEYLSVDQSIDQRENFANHIYHLIDYRELIYTGDVDLRLFECDAQDMGCKQLYQIKLPWTNPKSLEIISAKKALVTTPNANSITLQINGETVYSHPVK